MNSNGELIEYANYFTTFQQMNHGSPLNIIDGGLLFVDIAGNGTMVNNARILGRDYEGAISTLHTINSIDVFLTPM